MPQEVYMAALAALVIIFSFVVIAAPRYSDASKMIMAVATPLCAFAIGCLVTPDSIWTTNSRTFVAGLIGYPVLMILSVNAGVRWREWRVPSQPALN